MRVIHNTHSKDQNCQMLLTLKINFADPSRPAQSPLDQAEAFHFYQQKWVLCRQLMF